MWRKGKFNLQPWDLHIHKNVFAMHDCVFSCYSLIQKSMRFQNIRLCTGNWINNCHFILQIIFQEAYRLHNHQSTSRSPVNFVHKVSGHDRIWRDTQENILERNLTVVRSVGNPSQGRIIWEYTRWYILTERETDMLWVFTRNASWRRC